MTEERSAENEHLADAWGSGRSSHEGSELLDEDTDFLTDTGAVHHEMRMDDQAIQQNGGTLRSSEDSDMTDGEGEDSLDDDMVDKISSSPSIDDGGCTLIPLRSIGHSRWSSSDEFEPPSLKPFVPFLMYSKDHRLSGEYMQEKGKCLEEAGLERRNARDVDLRRRGNDSELHRSSSSSEGSMNELLMERPHSSVDVRESTWLKSRVSTMPGSDASYQKGCAANGETGDDASNEIDADFDLRISDAELEGPCLPELEDIDFEFVYALHTFVATVEGQANATKGDTMVLLDDSNSYWWLVRVVKDSSIGTGDIPCGLWLN